MKLQLPGSVLLISCYELGHQPLGVALPLGFLRRAGFEPAAMDIAVEDFDADKVARADFIGISVPMHTALRLGVRVADRIRELNPDCHICFYGLYAALNSEYLLDHGADSCIGGECETPLVALVESIAVGTTDEVEGVIRRGKVALPVLQKLSFAFPERDALPSLDEYAHLEHDGDSRTAGYVEASRGCLHLCTHCPIPPVYGGRFFIVPREVVLEDVRRQVKAGATHITFGDPDFLNGPKHSLRIVRAMHEEFPSLTYDFTAKVEHLLNRGEDLPEFAAAGCLFIITAVESLSDRVLTILDKQHTREDVVNAVKYVRDAGIAPRPTWVTFTPWTTLEDFLEVLEFIEENGLIDHIDPVQYSIRLLIPPGSWLAEHEETLPYRGPLDEAAFTYRWTHPDPRMDQLQKDVAHLVERDAQADEDAAATFYRVKDLAYGRQPVELARSLPADRQRAPRMSESWFC
ncbi:MAG TPA: CUAEP/CCAEP-tail radical SAM protein [Pirellulaceae bacterium]|nr:CUAEP/CCAEP-tail radical SAM protein [Pirellulaceae bacterium]